MVALKLAQYVWELCQNVVELVDEFRITIGLWVCSFASAKIKCTTNREENLKKMQKIKSKKISQIATEAHNTQSTHACTQVWAARLCWRGLFSKKYCDRPGQTAKIMRCSCGVQQTLEVDDGVFCAFLAAASSHVVDSVLLSGEASVLACLLVCFCVCACLRGGGCVCCGLVVRGTQCTRVWQGVSPSRKKCSAF